MSNTPYLYMYTYKKKNSANKRRTVRQQHCGGGNIDKGVMQEGKEKYYNTNTPETPIWCKGKYSLTPTYTFDNYKKEELKKCSLFTNKTYGEFDNIAILNIVGRSILVDISNNVQIRQVTEIGILFNTVKSFVQFPILNNVWLYILPKHFKRYLDVTYTQYPYNEVAQKLVSMQVLILIHSSRIRHRNQCVIFIKNTTKGRTDKFTNLYIDTSGKQQDRNTEHSFGYYHNTKFIEIGKIEKHANAKWNTSIANVCFDNKKCFQHYRTQRPSSHEIKINEKHTKQLNDYVINVRGLLVDLNEQGTILQCYAIQYNTFLKTQNILNQYQNIIRSYNNRNTPVWSHNINDDQMMQIKKLLLEKSSQNVILKDLYRVRKNSSHYFLGDNVYVFLERDKKRSSSSKRKSSSTPIPQQALSLRVKKKLNDHHIVNRSSTAALFNHRQHPDSHEQHPDSHEKKSRLSRTTRSKKLTSSSLKVKKDLASAGIDHNKSALPEVSSSSQERNNDCTDCKQELEELRDRIGIIVEQCNLNKADLNGSSLRDFLVNLQKNQYIEESVNISELQKKWYRKFTANNILKIIELSKESSTFSGFLTAAKYNPIFIRGILLVLKKSIEDFKQESQQNETPSKSDIRKDFSPSLNIIDNKLFWNHIMKDVMEDIKEIHLSEGTDLIDKEDTLRIKNKLRTAIISKHSADVKPIDIYYLFTHPIVPPNVMKSSTHTASSTKSQIISDIPEQTEIDKMIKNEVPTDNKKDLFAFLDKPSVKSTIQTTAVPQSSETPPSTVISPIFLSQIKNFKKVKT